MRTHLGHKVDEVLELFGVIRGLEEEDVEAGLVVAVLCQKLLLIAFLVAFDVTLQWNAHIQLLKHEK